jgi:hypothetical protein
VRHLGAVLAVVHHEHLELLGVAHDELRTYTYTREGRE